MWAAIPTCKLWYLISWSYCSIITMWRNPHGWAGKPPLSFSTGSCKSSQSVLEVITDLETNLHQKQPMAKSSPLIPVPISWSLWPCGLYIILSPGFGTGEVDVFRDLGESWLSCIPLCWLLLTDSSLVSTDYQELHSVQVENENTTLAQRHSAPELSAQAEILCEL